MKRKIRIKATVFLLIFCVLFLGVQEILRYKFTEFLAERYQAYMEEEGDVDVVFIGGSTTYAGIAPTIMWKERGITSYNFGISSTSALISYYQAVFALQVQKPRLVVLDLSRICKTAKADDRIELENVHREAVEAMPIRELRRDLLLQIKADNPNQDLLTYILPLLPFHSRWNELNKRDFVPEEYPEYTKGALFRVKDSEETVECKGELFDESIKPTPAESYSWDYYKQIMDLCAENGIAVAVINFPKQNTREMIGQYKTIERICNRNNIPYYNLSSPEGWRALGIDGATDFYNANHVNASGATKVSRALAIILQEDFDLPDHRGDPVYSTWDDSWDAFYEANRNVLESLGY